MRETIERGDDRRPDLPGQDAGTAQEGCEGQKDRDPGQARQHDLGMMPEAEFAQESEDVHDDEF
jgi:hypothetical protein